MASFLRQNELTVIHIKWHTFLCIMTNKVSKKIRINCLIQIWKLSGFPAGPSIFRMSQKFHFKLCSIDRKIVLPFCCTVCTRHQLKKKALQLSNIRCEDVKIFVYFHRLYFNFYCRCTTVTVYTAVHNVCTIPFWNSVHFYSVHQNCNAVIFSSTKFSDSDI
jgi:hypothetical protein